LGILKSIAVIVGVSFCFFCLGCGVPLQAPSISQILPQTIPAGSNSVTMKVVGTNFTTKSVILWNGSTLTTSVVDSKTLAATVASSSLVAPAVVQLKVQDALTGKESQPVQVTVASAASSSSLTTSAFPLAISTVSLPSGSVGASYGVHLSGTSYGSTLSASGGNAPYAWSVTSGQLPSGLSIAAATGVISGTPTASGTTRFTVTVKDSSNPVQTASASESITVAPNLPNPLTITTSTLPPGTDSKAYAQVLQASGGTPAYTWSITSGSLPAGLSLSATTGVISGTPTTSGTSTFTTAVTDNSNPAQTKSLATSILVAAAQQISGTGTTWYVNGSGGTRFSINKTTGLCDGTSPAAPVGTTPNQHCAFGDIRYLWTDGSYNVNLNAGAPAWGWIGAGGDTYLIDCPTGNTWCRVGQSGPNGNDSFGLAGNPQGAGAPAPPSGASSAHTRILGLNFANCTSPGAKAFVNGGYGIGRVFGLGGSAYVDVECIDITDHAQCTRVGVPAYPSRCNTDYPLDDYATGGISTNDATSNILLQDINIHGLTDYGLIGPIGGLITMNRVRVAFNGSAGWEFDDGKSTADAAGSFINATNVTMEGNGCNEEYPIVHAFPAISCYDDTSGGFGDAWSAQGTGSGGQTSQLSMSCDQCIIRYNTKDGFGMNHILFNSLSITNSQSYGNSGQQWKWSAFDGANIKFTNNLTMGNCRRMASAIPGAPSTFNTYLSDFCRAAGDNIALAVSDGSTTLVADNTVAGYAATTFDISCSGANTDKCSSATLVFRNNILLGFSNPDFNSGTLPGAYYQNNAVVAIRDHNLYYHERNEGCPTTRFTGEVCSDPLLVGEPASTITQESSLDDFNFHLTSASPAIGAGVAITGITTDFAGETRSNPTAIGAYE